MTNPPRPPQVVHGDCIEIMKMLPNDSVDSIVTDPPYGLGFMGKAWDKLPPGENWARECLRVLKPGGHLLAFGGTRTWHRLAVAVEDAGFEIRDSIAWMYGSGFPKSLDVSKAIDKQRDDAEPSAAVARFLVDYMGRRGVTRADVNRYFGHSTAGGGAAQQWTTTRTDWALKPRVPKWEQWQDLREWLGIPDDMDAEVWRLNGRKGTPGEAFHSREILAPREVADIRNGHGREYGGAMFAGEATGKIQHAITAPATAGAKQWAGWGTALKPAFEPIVMARKPIAGTVAANVLEHGTGALNIAATRHGERWPANVVLDESQAGALAESRYFYVAKPSKAERPVVDGVAHPTVKPLALMRHLVKLVTPPGGTVLEPFAGSGATVEACILEGFHCIAVEQEAGYLPLIQARIERQEAA